MSVLLAAIASLAIGVSDYFNRRVAMQVGVWTIALWLQGFAAMTAVFSLSLVEGTPTVRDLLIGSCSGICMAIALGAFYVGVTRSTATIVAPIVGVLSTVVPYVYALATGATAGPVAIIGAVLSVLGIVIISLRGVSARGGAVEGRSEPRLENIGAGVLFGSIAGLGYAFAFVALLSVDESAGTWPIVSERFTATLLTLIVVIISGEPKSPPAGLRRNGVAGGLLGGCASTLFILARDIDAAKAVVVISTYPAIIVLVGYLAFEDPVTRRQLFGLSLVLAGVALIAGG